MSVLFASAAVRLVFSDGGDHMRPGSFSHSTALAAPAPRKRRARSSLISATCCASLALAPGRAALAQVAATLNGAPVQVQPYVPEPGVPLITITPGTLNPFPSGSASSFGNGGTGNGATGTGAAGGSSGGSEALTTMLGQPWGAAAVSNAQAVGINPSALAATCVIESGCQHVGGTGTITGAFQMTAATYTSMINAAVARNPSLASQVVPGLTGQSDPATQAIAASEYLYEGALAIQAAGISNPTVTQTRGYFNFGPSNGVALATADPKISMSAAMPNVSAATLKANGITPGETVAQWQAAFSSKIGTAANQPVLGT